MSGDGDNGDQDQGSPFFWWYGYDLYDFFATVAKYGQDNVYIEMHEEGEGDDKETFLDVFLIGTGEQVGHYNDSHICPPDCEGSPE